MDITFILDAVMILLFARLAGELFARRGYPSVVGEILVGIVLGPSVLRLIIPKENLGLFAEMGFSLVLLCAGLSLDTRRLLEATKRGAIVSVFNVAATLGLGYFVGRAFGYTDISSFSIGIALTISSVGMGTRVLMDLNKLNTSAGMTLISVAVIDDISEILMLGMVLALAKGGSTAAANSLTLQAFKVIIFFLLVYIVGFYARIPERFGKFVGKASSQGSRLSYLFTIMLSMMGIAQVAGLHMIIGAFFGGLMVNRAFKEDRETLRTTTLITLGFFAPFAYAWVGLNTIASTLISNLPLLGSILVAGVGAEILGGFLGSRCAGLRWEECLVVGVGLTGRAGIELAVIEVMREAGLITSEIFASFVILTALACLLMPFMLRFACRCAWRT